MNSNVHSTPGTPGETRPRPRTSEALRGILTKNPRVKAFSVERILSSLGAEHFEASLVAFSLPAILPVYGSTTTAALPAGVIGYQMFSGREKVRLPRFVLRKTVSRRVLAVAIHAALPILEAAEKVLRPRWGWACHAHARRAIGLFVFILALGVAYPLFGFNALHATSIFVMAVGMAEQDGLAVLLGAAVGLLSLVLLVASAASARTLHAHIRIFARRMARKASVAVLAGFLGSHGHESLARLLRFQWSRLLWLWDPEKRAAVRARRARAASGAVPQPRQLSTRLAAGVAIPSVATKLGVRSAATLVPA